MIISRYVLREIAVTLAAVTAVIYIIYISNRFVQFLGDAAEGSLPGNVVLVLLALKSLSNLITLFPLAVFFAVILAFGRFYRDNEMVALAACGIGPGRLMRTVGVLALICAALVAAVALYFGPWAERKAHEIQEQAKARAEVMGVAAGRFQEMRNGRLVFYVEELTGGRQTLRHVFVRSQRQGVPNVVSADRGHLHQDPETGHRYLVLEDGYRYEGRPGSAEFKLAAFKEHGVLIETREAKTSTSRLEAARTTDLWQSTANIKATAELQWRLSMALSTLVLALLAVPLSRTSPRQGRYGKFLVAVLVYMIYTNLLTASRAWLEQGVIDPMLGMWWVHGLAGLLIGGLWVQPRPRRGRRRGAA